MTTRSQVCVTEHGDACRTGTADKRWQKKFSDVYRERIDQDGWFSDCRRSGVLAAKPTELARRLAWRKKKIESKAVAGVIPLTPVERRRV